MTYNIHSLRDDPAAIVRVIRNANPDVVCIQEAPRFVGWRTRCRKLARATRLKIACGGREAAANLLLVRPSIAVEATQTALLTPDRGIHQRGVAMALLRVDGDRVVIAGTHLDGYPEPRLRHVREISQELWRFAPNDAPWVLAGDFNSDPGSKTWEALGNIGRDAFAEAGVGTGYTIGEDRRIDGIFAAPTIGVASCRVLDSEDVKRASDHQPVLTELLLFG